MEVLCEITITVTTLSAEYGVRPGTTGEISAHTSPTGVPLASEGRHLEDVAEVVKLLPWRRSYASLSTTSDVVLTHTLGQRIVRATWESVIGLTVREINAALCAQKTLVPSLHPHRCSCSCSYSREKDNEGMSDWYRCWCPIKRHCL